ncbi:MAG: hypothetical protein EPN39_00345 [Chitinophagaceae bacterium]|nr:MAG: hypothetical protein EPN39_00345 [Chitinophagaceae bacterium]
MEKEEVVLNNEENTLEKTLFLFMAKAEDDPRLGPPHISLYLSLLLQFKKQGCVNPISVFSKSLRSTAKIAARVTYQKCIHELKEYGYIDYHPSYNHTLGNLFWV